jgi:hypothetical protein
MPDLSGSPVFVVNSTGGKSGKIIETKMMAHG